MRNKRHLHNYIGTVDSMAKNKSYLKLSIGCVAFIASIIAIITWPRVPTLEPYTDQGARAEQIRPVSLACSPVTIAAIRDGRERTSRADACAEKVEEHRLSTNDLIQQTRAADAAGAQAIIAGQGLWTAWFQTIGSFITLAAAIGAAIYARAAALETKRSADAADESLRYFVDIERARIVAEPIGATPYADHIIMANLQLSNIGRSTAAIAECRSAMMAGVTFPAEFPVTCRIDTVIKMDESYQSGCIPIDTRKLEELPFVGGYVEYQSAFGAIHRSYFLTRIERSERNDFVISSYTHYCQKHEREGRFGWPSDG